MNYNPTVDYRSDRVPHVPDAQQEPRSRITEVATRVALSVAVAIWAVVGFLIWVPLLLRRIATFVVELTYVTLTDGDPNPAAKRLRAAANFYRRGFVTAVRSVLTPGEGAADAGPGPDTSTPARPILQEVAWALVVWYPVLLWLGIAEWTPEDLWNAAAAVPWQEIGMDVVDGAVVRIEELAGRLGL